MSYCFWSGGGGGGGGGGWECAHAHLGVQGLTPVGPTLSFILGVTWWSHSVHLFSPWLLAPAPGLQPPFCHFAIGHRAESNKNSPPYSTCTLSMSDCLSVLFSFRSSWSRGFPWSSVPYCCPSACICDSVGWTVEPPAATVRTSLDFAELLCIFHIWLSTSPGVLTL